MSKDKGSLDRARFTLEQEISSIIRLKKTIKTNLGKAIAILRSRKGKIILTGIGKSGFIGMKISATFTSMGNPAVFLHPVEALHGDTGMVSDGDVVIAVSFSGNSREVVRIVKYLKKEFAIKTISITGNRRSLLARISDANIVLNVQKEGSPYGMAPMASTTTSLVIGDMLVSAITSLRNFKKSNFAKLHPSGSLGLEFKTVKSYMTPRKEVPVVVEKADSRMMINKMNNKHPGVVAVVNSSGKLTGVVTDGDVRRFLVSGREIGTARVKEIMTKNPKKIRETSSLKTALSTMEDFRITSLFAVDSRNKLKGIIHIHDIVGGVII
ncbi:MAG: KpsF/GutQ family sugar-phosphate isomerase [Patescibacteria group bacterium]